MTRTLRILCAGVLLLSTTGCARHALINPHDENAEYRVASPGGSTIQLGDTVTLDSAYINSPGTSSFVIRTSGTPLTLSGEPRVAIDTTDTAAFTVTAQPDAALEDYDSTEFTIEFAPDTEGLQSAAIAIEINGRSDMPFTFTVEATGLASVIGLEEGATEYVPGATYDFGGPLPPGEIVSVEFRIRNEGENTVELTGDSPIAISGTHASSVSVTEEPVSPIEAGDSTLFTVAFAPTEPGVNTAVLTIEVNGHAEGAHILNLTGNLSSAIIVDAPGNVGSYLSMAAEGSNVWISYYDATDYDLKVATSTDSGAAWSTTTVDSADDVGEHTSIFVDTTNVYVAYRDDTNDDIKFARSTDSGATWPSGSIVVIDSIYLGGYTHVAAVGTHVYVSYDDGFNTSVAHSGDSGATWPSTVAVDADGTFETSIAVIGTTVHLSYYDEIDDDLRFATSTDSGATWPTNTTVATSGYVGRHSSLEVEGSNVFISYYSTGASIRFARSSNGGITWSNYTVYELASSTSSTSLIADGDTLRICFTDAGALLVATSTDAGVTWQAPVTLVSTGVGDYSCIAAAGDSIFVCYHDEREDDLGFISSSDGGATW